MEIKRGDIFFADLSPVLGAEMGGIRYVVVVQDDELNDEVSLNGGTVIVAPISSNSSEIGTEDARAIIPADIPELSLFSYQILPFEIRAIDTKRLKDYVGHLSNETMAELDRRLKFVLSIKE